MVCETERYKKPILNSIALSKIGCKKYEEKDLHAVETSKQDFYPRSQNTYAIRTNHKGTLGAHAQSHYQ